MGLSEGAVTARLLALPSRPCPAPPLPAWLGFPPTVTARARAGNPQALTERVTNAPSGLRVCVSVNQLRPHAL